VTLMGLISKHAILIVEFANELQRNGVSKLSSSAWRNEKFGRRDRNQASSNTFSG